MAFHGDYAPVTIRITDKGMRTGGCYLHEPRINPPYRSLQP